MDTERLHLRPHQPGDAGWLYRLYSNPEVARYLLDEPWTAELTARRLAERLSRTDLDGEEGALALVVEYERTPVGDVQLWFTDRARRVAEIGWVLDPAHGGRGLATEAVGAVLALAFEHAQLHRVVAMMDARNTPSARLARRVGMSQEAHLRQAWWSKGEWNDTLIFAMLAADRTG
ncbi:GNAT family N-acetyltransferase [Spiractinospora alimapuensis]|uniref:GNAT family N-acetyltransferase n=1 Tax=Spiractinospora alimapuensis TaxID=2820884 RepID=UPI001F1AE02F|nr:GNAT family N-acetyltransferase [Spiractinospora alimapuensis]QVQ52954.1 GNAT family N-acetyltransferase [Spiractinospora alimapuensis]